MNKEMALQCEKNSLSIHWHIYNQLQELEKKFLLVNETEV